MLKAWLDLLLLSDPSTATGGYAWWVTPNRFRRRVTEKPYLLPTIYIHVLPYWPGQSLSGV